MRSFKTLPQPVLEVILWVPDKVLDGWFSSDPEDAARVAHEATRRLGETSTGDHVRHEDELLVARLVLSGGSELDLLRLAASGIIASKEVFHRAASWVKWRRTAHTIIQMPEAQAVRHGWWGTSDPSGGTT